MNITIIEKDVNVIDTISIIYCLIVISFAICAYSAFILYPQTKILPTFT
tara:strand:+ start:3104 stop:3250 length:147 start_codon:yes stop_codon:yes gene_type:complete